VGQLRCRSRAGHASRDPRASAPRAAAARQCPILDARGGATGRALFAGRHHPGPRGPAVVAAARSAGRGGDCPLPQRQGRGHRDPEPVRVAGLADLRGPEARELHDHRRPSRPQRPCGLPVRPVLRNPQHGPLESTRLYPRRPGAAHQRPAAHRRHALPGGAGRRSVLVCLGAHAVPRHRALRVRDARDSRERSARSCGRAWPRTTRASEPTGSG
jgi:hypothetical protein